MPGRAFHQQLAPAATGPSLHKTTPEVPPVRPRARTPLAAVIQCARLNPRSLTRDDIARLHRSIGNAAVGRLLTGTTAPNRTGLPDRLKANVEAMSNLPMDDVRVHHNSPKPAELQAHAYARGTEIHLGPGQERHLPHEAWHVVQQKQGRVKPTLQFDGTAINDEKELEREAEQAFGLVSTHSDGTGRPSQVGSDGSSVTTFRSNHAIIQRHFAPEYFPAVIDMLKLDNYTNDRMMPDIQILKELICAYLAIPVGSKYQTFLDLVEEADDINRKHHIESNIAENFRRSAEVTSTDTVQQLQDIALRVEEAFALKDEDEALRGRFCTLYKRIPEIMKIDWRNVASKQQFRFFEDQRLIERSMGRGELEGVLSHVDLLRFIDIFGRMVEASQNIEPEKEYDTSWKKTEMSHPIIGDSDGAVIGVTIALTLSDVGQGIVRLRRRLTMSKGRHMWAFLDAATTEPKNSLIAGNVSVQEIEGDLIEIAHDYKMKAETKLAAEYQFIARSGRVYYVNRTENEYPHCFPLRGPGVVPMDDKIFNFLYEIKKEERRIMAGEADVEGSVRAQLEGSGVAGRLDDVLQALYAVQARSKVYELVRHCLTTETRRDTDAQSRASAKGKKTKPRSFGQQEKKGWNQ